VHPITALSIAGSDSGGGAGIQADIRSFNAFEVHATTAVTAITAQNTVGVNSVYEIPTDMVEAQIRAVITDFEVKATKTGMLALASTVERVAQLASDGLLPHLVVDPVLVSTSGHVLMQDGGVRAYQESLIPLAEVVTPNLFEAAILCNVDVRDVASLDDVMVLAETIKAMGPQYVLIKGGHFVSVTSHAPDVLLGAEGHVVFDGARVDTNNDHGTGCSLSSAIAAGLGLDRSVLDATRDAKSFVLSALQGASQWHLGRGRGPIDHLGWNE
jgi:hydroxymethylpyrimidine/phosphomethylpyrimidine kinase